MLINGDQCTSMLINVDQCRSEVDPAQSRIDQQRSAQIFIDQSLSEFIDPYTYRSTQIIDPTGPAISKLPLLITKFKNPSSDDANWDRKH